MKRAIYKDLLKWKNSSRRKPLLLKGARQVGKTWILKEFGKNEYEKTAYFNFEEDPNLKEFFTDGLFPKEIIKSLSIYIKWKILPERHLIIFDEIQISNEALNSLKYFYEQANQYHIISAGSLLGIKLSGDRSFPVGSVNFLDMYPMTFLEFLDGIGETSLKELIDTTKVIQPYPEPLHRQMIEKLREYYFVGGMPEVVKHFAQNRNYDEVKEIQKEILTSYTLDFTKYAKPNDIPKLSIVWNSIPSQLAKENKKFIFSVIRKSARAREYENAIQWLEDSRLLIRCYRVNKIYAPLKAYIDRNSFKVFSLDIGLLGRLANIDVNMLILGDRIFNEYKGAFVENYVAQQLHSMGIDFYYWTSSGKAEIDFIFENSEGIFPLEAKSGINPKSKSLKVYAQKYQPIKLYRTTLLNLKKDGKIINIPLYAISLLKNKLKTEVDYL